MRCRRLVPTVAALAGLVAATGGGCGSPPVHAPRDPIDVAPPTTADLADSARGATEGPRPDPKSTSRVLAWVNGEVVSYRDVYVRAANQLAVVDDPELKARIERMELIGIVRDRLLHQAAVEAGIDVDRDAIDEERAKKVRELARTGGTLDAYLAERGMTRREHDETLRRDLRASRYLRAAVGLGGEGAARVRARTDTWVTPGEVRKYYERHPERYHEPATARVRKLTVTADRDADDREAAVAAALERIEGYRRRLEAGEDFVPVFREANPDVPEPGDGLLEMTERGKKAPWIEDFAFREPRGRLSEIIRQPPGGPVFHLLRAEGVTPERQRPFEEVQREIESELLQQRRAIASLVVELGLLEEAVVRPPELAAELRENLSGTLRRIVAAAGL